LDKPTNALSWGRKPAAFTKLIELTQRLFEDRHQRFEPPRRRECDL
jgi:hypothetical protein